MRQQPRRRHVGGLAAVVLVWVAEANQAGEHVGSDAGGFLLGGHLAQQPAVLCYFLAQLEQLDMLGALRFLPAGHAGFLPRGIFLESVAALGANGYAHVLTPKFPEIPENGVLRFPETPKFPAAPLGAGENGGSAG